MELPHGVYILLCSDKTYYTGYTSNIQNRLNAHRNKEVQYTKSRLAIKLINLFCSKANRKPMILSGI